MYHLRVPQTAEELESYYQFRWEMLRKPLHQPKGSERDAWDAMAHHQMVVDEEGNLVAVGRLYINAENEASIRFMAVHPSVQDKGLGTLMAMTLESVARQEGVKRVTCSAREDAVEFFAKLGFVNQGEITTPTTTPIRHFLMIKPVASLDDILHRGDWCAQLQQAWYQHIPLSEKMGVRIQQYTGQKFITTMPEAGNQNPHHMVYGGGSAKESGLLERISESLKAADLVPIELGGVTPNPQLSFVSVLLREYPCLAAIKTIAASISSCFSI